MGSYLSFLPAWMKGPPEDENVAYQIEDNPNAGIQAANAREAIAAGYRAWTTAFEKKNFTAISLLYTQDCKVCPSASRSAFGRQECHVGWESLIKTGVERISFSDTLIESSSGDVNAIAESSNYHMYGANNQPIDNGKHMMIWKKINGKWFIHLHVFSSNKSRQKSALDYVTEACTMWEHAFFARDFPAIQDLYTDDCKLCPPAWPQVVGSLSTQRFWARFPSMGVDHVERMPTSVEEMGPGLMSAEIRYTMYDYRNGVIDIGKCLLILKKSKDGRWCIHSEMFNSDSSLPSVSTEDETTPPSTPKDLGQADNLGFTEP